MPPRTSFLLASVIVSVAVVMFPQTVAAQARGMGGAPRGMHGGIPIRGAHHVRLTHGEHRRSYGGFLFYPDYFDDYDRNYEPPEVNHNVDAEPKPNVAAATAAKPAESLILENRGGQWVRIPTASQMPVAAGYEEPQASNSGPRTNGSKVTAAPPDKLPPAVLVFLDGHEEEVARYVVQGKVLYTSSDYWSTGSWTREIPIVELDVPASVKRNAERGGIFSLPTRPNEVVVRF